MKNGLFSVALLAACLAGAKSVEWNTPESLAMWTKRGHQVASASVKDGALHVVCGGVDTHIYSGTFDLASSAAQERRIPVPSATQVNGLSAVNTGTFNSDANS